MQVTLPYTKYKVTLEDFVPEAAVIATDEILLVKQNLDDISWERVTLDQIASALPEDYDAIQKEKDEGKKDKLITRAKRKYALTDPDRNGITAAEMKEASRIKVAYMIKEVKAASGTQQLISINVDKKDVVLSWLKQLPSVDVAFLRDKVAEIEEKMERFLGGTGGA